MERLISDILAQSNVVYNQLQKEIEKKDEFTDIVNNIAKLSVGIGKKSSEKSVEDKMLSYVDYYNKVDMLKSYFTSLLNLLDDKTAIEKITSGMSQTFTDDIVRNIDLLKKLNDSFESMNSGERQLAELREKFNKLEPKKNAKKITDIIMASDKPNDFITFSTKELIRILPSSPALNSLIAKLEEFKNASLGAYWTNNSNRLHIEEGSVAERLIVRYGIIPITEYTSLENIFLKLGNKKLLYDPNVKDHENINNILTFYNVLLIQKYYKEYIDFNPYGIIDRDYIVKNNLESSKNSGLNSRIIRKFSTVNAIRVVDGAQIAADKSDGVKYCPQNSTLDAKFNCDLGAKNTDKTIILDKHNGNYRLLSDSEKPIVADCVAKRFEIGLSARPHIYHKIMEQEIIRNGIDPNHRNIMLEYSDTSRKIDSSTLKNKLVEEMKELFSSEYQNKDPTNLRDLTELFKSIRLDCVIERVIGNYFEYLEDFPYLTEVKMTFLGRLDAVIDAFERRYNSKYEEAFNEKKLSRRVFEEIQGEERSKYIIGTFTDIIESVVESMSQPPSYWEEFDLTLKEFVFMRKYK